jgi:phosphatidylinositol 4-kinase A
MCRYCRHIDIFARWSFGADRVQLEREIKVLNEFLLLVQGDSVKNAYLISSLDSSQNGSGRSSNCAPSSSVIDISLSDEGTSFKDLNQLLRLLVESEISRLCVWGNPTNDARRGGDHGTFIERGLTDVNTKFTAFLTLIDYSN